MNTMNTNEIMMLDPRAIVRGENARVEASPEGMEQLVASVRRLGVVVPVLVRAGDDGEWVLVAGGRRVTAAIAAGLESVPAVVLEGDEFSAWSAGMVENVVREDLPADMLAAAVADAVAREVAAEDAVAEAMGRPVGWVRDCVAAASLPRALSRWICAGSGAGVGVLASLARAGSDVVGLAVAWMEGGFGVPRSVGRWVAGLEVQAANEAWLREPGCRVVGPDEEARFFLASGGVDPTAGVEVLDGLVDRAVLRSSRDVPPGATWRDVVDGAVFEPWRSIRDGRRVELLEYAVIFAFDKSKAGRGWLRRTPLSGGQAEAREEREARAAVRMRNAAAIGSLVRRPDGLARVASVAESVLGPDVEEFAAEVAGDDAAARIAAALLLVLAQGEAVEDAEWWGDVNESGTGTDASEKTP
jgi:ParB/RepB/Spo0J family partition protein